jgi:hypothetical protein
MSLSSRTRLLSASALLLSASLAGAASTDYLLEIEGVAGEGSAPVTTLPLESWSFGASQAGSHAGGGGGGAGKVAASSGVVSPRDVSSGQATGKRVAVADADGDGAPDVASSSAQPSVGEVQTFTVMVRESPTRASTGRESPTRPSMGRESPTLPSKGGTAAREAAAPSASLLARACATGQHIAKATLRSSSQTVTLSDVTVTCPASSSGEMRVYEFRGHVTLMK